MLISEARFQPRFIGLSRASKEILRDGRRFRNIDSGMDCDEADFSNSVPFESDSEIMSLAEKFKNKAIIPVILLRGDGLFVMKSVDIGHIVRISWLDPNGQVCTKRTFLMLLGFIKLDEDTGLLHVRSSSIVPLLLGQLSSQLLANNYGR
ncbi:hypothetical protein BX666DRAFT_1881196 [Dichotomocladium elegans]|nr:hypothetical protein BX666DRAFT_1881196 [Dichotomocladium elegans]